MVFEIRGKWPIYCRFIVYSFQDFSEKLLEVAVYNVLEVSVRIVAGDNKWKCILIPDV